MSRAPLGTTEVLGAAWNAVAEEMGRAMVRTAISPNVKERRDCSAAVFTHRGELLAQAAHIPIHLSSMLELAGDVAGRDDLKEGDVFVCNDPYSGGGAHLNDIAVMTGVFSHGQLAGLVGTIAHHPDVGGRVPGSETADSSEIFQEGLRIPPVRLCRRWRPIADIWRLVTINTRLGAVIEADLRSQVAACKVGVARSEGLLKRYGRGSLEAEAALWLDYSERRFRTALSRVKPLLLKFVGELDDDGRGGPGAFLRGEVKISRGRVQVDLRGCAPQVAGALNSPLGSTRAAVLYALKTAIDPGCPSNAGYFRVVEMLTSSGTVVDPIPPAATGHRIAVCQKLADAILRAVAEAHIENGLAGSHGTSLIILSGESNGRRFVDYEGFAGGLGASAIGHGSDGMMAHVTNTSNLPIEVMEFEYPLRVRTYQIRRGSGGGGVRRGGDGVVREIEVLTERVLLTTGLMDARIPPRGVGGGLDGLAARCLLKRGRRGGWRSVPPHISELTLHKGDILRVESAGGGGWGSAKESDMRD
jgi:N-methylhydantoinase B